MHFDIVVLFQCLFALGLGLLASYVFIFLCAVSGAPDAPRYGFVIFIGGILYHYIVSICVTWVIQIFAQIQEPPNLRAILYLAVAVGLGSRIHFWFHTKTDYIAALSGILLCQTKWKIPVFEAIAIAVNSIRDSCPHINTNQVLLVAARNACTEEAVRYQLQTLGLFRSES